MFKWAFSLLSGRTTAFCGAFFVMGNVMHAMHRLDAMYITFMSALMGFVVAHSVKEDVFAAKDADRKALP
jgi:hypothetical protein